MGNWPPADWRPYSDDSPFNQVLPEDPRLHPRSSAVVARLTEQGGPSDLRAGIADSDGDVQHPTYWSTADDPVFTIHCTRPYGRCEIEGMKVRIPDRARPAGGSDAHLTVVDQRSGWEYDLWEVESKPSGGGELVTGYGGRTRIDGDGLASDATAAHFGLLAGIIRAEELLAGRIDHALFLVADCDSGEFVYPARGRGAPCEDRTDAPAEGMRFQLDMSDAEIRALGRAALEAGDPAGPGALRHVRRRHRRIPVGPRVRVRVDLHELRLSRPDPQVRQADRHPARGGRPLPLRPGRGDRLEEPPAGGRSVRERAELLTRLP